MSTTNPWLIKAVQLMQARKVRMTVAELREALGDPKRGRKAHKLLHAAEARGFVHSSGRAASRAYTVGIRSLSAAPVEIEIAAVGRDAPRYASVWAMAQGVQA